MRRIKKAKNKNKEEQKLSSRLFNTKGKVIGALVTCAVILLIVFILLFVENTNHGKLIVKNNTDMNLEYLTTWFVGEVDIYSENVKLENINAGDTVKKSITPINLQATHSNLEIRFKTAGSDEILTDVGDFSDTFNGNIIISFKKTDNPDQIQMKVTAKNGLFQSKTINCDETLIVDLKEGLVLE